MADSKELKPKSFRIDDETNEKLKELMKNFPNQNIAIQKMIEAFEFQQGKEVLVEKKADIEEFENYVGCLVRMYMTSLETNQNQKELIRSEFDGQLRTKDALLQEKQEQLTVAKQLKEEATLRANAHANENEDLKQTIERLNTEYNAKMNDMQDMLQDKDNLNKALISSCNDLKAEVEQMAAEEEQNKILNKELDSIKAEYGKLETIYKSLQADFSHEKEKHEQELDQMKKTHSRALQRVQEQEQIKLDKALLELEKQHQEQIKQLNEQYQAKLMEIWNTKQPNKKKNDKSNNTPIQQILEQDS